VNPKLLLQLRERRAGTYVPRLGEAIFTGSDTPRTWAALIGQREAKAQLQAAVESVLDEDARLPHVLLASGHHGIGKTSIAKILAYDLGVRMLELSGAVTAEQFRAALGVLDDKDVVFWDEFHTAVGGNRNRADYLLSFMLEHALVTPTGREEMPDVTLIAATTDAGRLPETILSRFFLKPLLADYSDLEGRMLVLKLAERMGLPRPTDPAPIAMAANNNPRAIQEILLNLKFANVDPSRTPAQALGKAILWSGLSEDGLSKIAREILVVLLASKEHTASKETIAQMLGEPGPLAHHEKQLLQRGLIVIRGQGRTLTSEGEQRAWIAAMQSGDSKLVNEEE